MTSHQCCLLFMLVFFIGNTWSEMNEGDICIDEYTNTIGRCTRVDICDSARSDLQKNGVRPTFCVYNFDSVLVCCRDGSSILQTPKTPKLIRPIKNRNNAQSRVSERKCQEYSEAVVQTVDFVPLLPDPEPMTITASNCKYAGTELIVGGETAKLGEFPHMAAIGWVNDEGGYNFDCGGSLISPRYVLTVGHCTSSSRAVNPQPVIVRLGEQNIDPAVEDGAYPVEVGIDQVVRHPSYKPPKAYNDIALFRLKTNVEFTNTIRPACLWNKDGFGNIDKAIATGWGVRDSATNQVSSDLQKVALSIIDNSSCNESLRYIHSRRWSGFSDGQMCAGELRGGKDTCKGDSGSPLQVVDDNNQCIFYIVGLTSHGPSYCGHAPAIYTKVSSYIDWIEGVVWPDE